MPCSKTEITELIRKAFHGVTLGSGIGLWEGQAIDDHENEATRKIYRERDEKLDWERIPVEALNRCQSSLSFFDPEGMRFHLPAFMIAEVEGKTDVGCIFSLTHLDEYGRSKLAAISTEQSKAIREFLLFLRDSPDYHFDRPDIDRALSGYWMPKE